MKEIVVEFVPPHHVELRSLPSMALFAQSAAMIAAHLE
jgi:hypothetical protein